MTINPAEAMAAIEAIQKHGLSLDYQGYDGRGYIAFAWNGHKTD